MAVLPGRVARSAKDSDQRSFLCATLGYGNDVIGSQVLTYMRRTVIARADPAVHADVLGDQGLPASTLGLRTRAASL
jgi:hypothetical protein